jgi:drug/metabolite transporter (DMT)-like permease
VPASLVTPLAYATVALAWSGGWIAGKLGVTAVPPLELSALRFVIAAPLLLLLARATGARFGTERLGLIALSAVFGIFGYNAFCFIGLTMAPASDAALIVPTLAPVLTAVMATAVGERLTTAKIGGFALAATGAVVVIAAGASVGGGISDRRLLGDLLQVGAAACWAAYTTIGTITLRSGSPLGVVALAATIGGALLIPLGFLENGYRDVPSWPVGAWLAIGYLAIFATIVGFVLFYWAVRRFGAGLAAMTTYLVPIGTLLLAFLVLGERPQPLQLVGGAVILAGVRVATRRPRTEPLPESAAA